MFKERSTQKLIEYIQTLPKEERQKIVEQISEPKAKKKPAQKGTAKRKVLSDIKSGLVEIKEAKRRGKKLKTLDTFLHEISGKH